MERNYDKLEKHCEIFSGYAFKSQDLLAEGDIPVVKIGNISNGKDVILHKDTQYVDKKFLSINEKFHIKKGDVLISLTGSHINQPNSMVGRSCRYYQKRELLLNQRAGKILAKKNNDLSFLYYMFTSWAMKVSITNRAYGAANQANVSPTDISNIKFNFPNYEIQKKIGLILSRYDEAIENNNKRIKLLEQMAQNLYKEWFVRFRFPGWENCEFENGIPVGWNIQKLEDFGIMLESGSRPSGGVDINLEEGIPSLGAECIKCLAEFDYSNIKYIPVDFYEKMKRGKNKGNHILLYKDGAYIGKVTLFRNKFPFEKYAINEHVFFLNSQNVNYLNWLYFTLKQGSYFNLMQNLNRNAAQPGLSQPDINRIKIRIPTEDVAIKFNEFVDPILNTVFGLAKANKNLAKQRDLLLPRLMSGKLEV